MKQKIQKQKCTTPAPAPQRYADPRSLHCSHYLRTCAVSPYLQNLSPFLAFLSSATGVGTRTFTFAAAAAMLFSISACS